MAELIHPIWSAPTRDTTNATMPSLWTGVHRRDRSAILGSTAC